MSAPDLVIGSHKLDTEFFTGHVQHTAFRSDASQGRRRVKVVKKWYRDRELGHGSFGTVFLERSENGEPRAVKEIAKDKNSRTRIDYRRELMAMAILAKHDGLFVQLFGWYENDNYVHIAMEYISHGHLRNYLEVERSESEAKVITRQLLEGLVIIHQEGFAHRDLKPEGKNIFVVSESPVWVKIGDFGLAKLARDGTAFRTQAFTNGYFAPEAGIANSGDSSEYTNAVDIWAIGCIAHEILTRVLPFPTFFELSLYCTRPEFPRKSMLLKGISGKGMETVESMLALPPERRIAAKEALDSEWLQPEGEREEGLETREDSAGLALPEVPAPQPPPQQSVSSGPDQHHSYLPFRLGDLPVPPPINSTTPGPSGHIPYDSGMASTIDARGSQPAAERRSVIYPPPAPARSQNMASPTDGALPPEPGPLEHVETAGNPWGLRPRGTMSEGIGGPAAKNKAPPFPVDLPVSSIPYFRSKPSSRESPVETYDGWKLISKPTQQPPTPATSVLTAVLPAEGVRRPKSTVLDDILETITEFGEDFSFIDEINAWYKHSSEERQRYQEEHRRIRADEHEGYTDRLFADHEIGYGDIEDMDIAFNEEENVKKAKEEEAELGRYCDDVFQKVYDKLQGGIKALTDKYFQTMNNIQLAVSGKDRWTRVDGPELTELLEGLLELRGQIERRHERVQEAILERDRRYRKTVIQPLYAAGNIRKMNAMEKQFDENEKKTILEAGGQKLARAQQLMETIGESAEGGLVAELNYTDVVTSAVNTLLVTPPPCTPSVKREIAYALEILQTLKQASVRIIKSFHAASILINEVTAEVGIAEGGEKDEIIRERMRVDGDEEVDYKKHVGIVEGDWKVIESAIKEALDAMRDVRDERGGEVGQGPPMGAAGPGPRPGLSALIEGKDEESKWGKQDSV